MVHIEKGIITVSISQDRWDKVKQILLWLETQMKEGDTIEFKTLESHRGFLVYIARTYPMINPYLKGIHGFLLVPTIYGTTPYPLYRSDDIRKTYNLSYIGQTI